MLAVHVSANSDHNESIMPPHLDNKTMRIARQEKEYNNTTITISSSSYPSITTIPVPSTLPAPPRPPVPDHNICGRSGK